MDNSVSEKPFASLIHRLTAYAVDALLLFVVVGLLLGGILAFILYLTVGFEWTRNGFLLWAYVFATASILFWLYYAFLESSERQATVGMRLLGLRVTGLNGEGISFRRALLRTVVAHSV